MVPSPRQFLAALLAGGAVANHNHPPPYHLLPEMPVQDYQYPRFSRSAEQCDISSPCSPAQLLPMGSHSEGWAFCGAAFKEGILPKSLELEGHHAIEAITVSYTDGTKSRFGRGFDHEGMLEKPTTATLDLDPLKDRIEYVAWYPHKDGGIGGLEIYVSGGKMLVWGPKYIKYRQPAMAYKPSGGMLLGIQGTAGNDLHSFDLITTKSKITALRVENITVTPNAGELNALHDKGLQEEHKAVSRHTQEEFGAPAKDSVSMSVSFSVSDSTSLQKTSSDAFSTTESMSETLSFTAGFSTMIPTIGTPSVGVTYAATHGQSVTWSNTKTSSITFGTAKTVSVTYSFSAEAVPNTEVQCDVWHWKPAASTEIKWYGDSVVHFEDKHLCWSWLSQGIYHPADDNAFKSRCRRRWLNETSHEGKPKAGKEEDIEVDVSSSIYGRDLKIGDWFEIDEYSVTQEFDYDL
ncbi:uncharacterized protein F5Z01DRAFT_676927 [Emericellopsis atlantica]|uniref:Uncharacterized protein n=1 Tax=Emericellopsis atlantica TaxID=2614577 RepID=A0A9P7ZGA0_9HYPO|nr:uncharacterized protein F5Z01DRAFT_676927 [Emericellopsis atlantica]KAG9251440.1 hypothetical protein F5Z01DRAFT_676927 [Emericellopsis atlantica]